MFAGFTNIFTNEITLYAILKYIFSMYDNKDTINVISKDTIFQQILLYIRETVSKPKQNLISIF